MSNFMNGMKNIVSNEVLSQAANSTKKAAKATLERSIGKKIIDSLVTFTVESPLVPTRLKALLLTRIGKNLTIAVVGQLIGIATLSLRPKLTPTNQKLLDLVTSASYMASADAALDATGFNEFLDRFVPQSIRNDINNLIALDDEDNSTVNSVINNIVTK